MQEKWEMVNGDLNDTLMANDELINIYSEFYESQNDLENFSDFYLMINRSFPVIKGQKGTLWAEKLNLDFPVLEEDINFLEFKLNGIEGEYIIADPIFFKVARYIPNNGLHGFMSKTIAGGIQYLSSGILIFDDEEICEECENIRITNRKVLTGNSKTSLRRLKKMYSTNVNSNDIEGDKFLSPSTVNHLTKIKDKNFTVMGIDGLIYARKCYPNKLIYPLGIFNFGRFRKYKDPVKTIIEKMFLELELFKRSVKYVSFIK